MNKQLKEVIQFYIGQEVKCGITSTAILRMERDYKNTISVKQVLGNDEYKLLLRPLSDMTEEELKESFEIEEKLDELVDDLDICKGEKYAAMTLWATKKGFDLFNLIPSKLAINKKTMK